MAAFASFAAAFQGDLETIFAKVIFVIFNLPSFSLVAR